MEVVSPLKMTKKSSSLAEYLSWLLQQYNEIRKETSQSTLYRLIEIKEKNDNQYELSFQIIGKATIFKTTPEYILNNEKIIEFFSSKDISIITQLACKKLNQPKNTILGKSFSQKMCKLLFRIKNINKNMISEYTASDLFNNKEFIKELSPEDALAIGYVAAQEKQEEERDTIEKLRLKHLA